MAEFPVEPMMSKMLIASEKYAKESTFNKFPHFFFFSWKQNNFFNLNISIKSISSIHHENVSKNIEWKTVFIYLFIYLFIFHKIALSEAQGTNRRE